MKKLYNTPDIGRLSEIKLVIFYIICNFKNPLVSREQLNQKYGATDEK